MNPTNVMVPLIKSTPHMSLLMLNFLWMYFTLGYRVRKTRKAFEKQLTAQGMSKKDAKQLSACYSELKDNVTLTIKQGLSVRGFNWS